MHRRYVPIVNSMISYSPSDAGLTTALGSDVLHPPQIAPRWTGLGFRLPGRSRGWMKTRTRQTQDTQLDQDADTAGTRHGFGNACYPSIHVVGDDLQQWPDQVVLEGRPPVRTDVR